MKKIIHILLTPSIFLLIEVLATRQFAITNRSDFVLANHLFFWGIFGILLSLILIFGFENRTSISLFSRNPQAPYDHNAANFLGHTTKNYFTRMTDLSSGTVILVIALVNLVLYFTML